MAGVSGLLKAILDAIHGSDEQIAGEAATRLEVGLDDAELGSMFVTSTVGFGEFTEGTGDARLVVGDELILASGRTDTSFTGLTRGVDNTKVPARHPAGNVVRDLSFNVSAKDLVKRGLFVNFAILTDLDVIGRNLGLKKCGGISDDVWRAIIRNVAYLAKQPPSAFAAALDALVGPSNYTIRERNISEPGKVIIEVDIDPIDTLKGQFFVQSNELQLSTGLTTVEVDNTIIDVPLDPGPGSLGVYGVFDDTPYTRLGHRDGFTNYFTGGSFLGKVITLGASPGAAGTPLIVDYNAFPAHYVALDETFVEDGDFYAYFSSRLDEVSCLLDQVRAAGIEVVVRERI